MPATQPLTEAASQEARRQNALTQLRRRYDELDKLTGRTAAERVAELRERQQASQCWKRRAFAIASGTGPVAALNMVSYAHSQRPFETRHPPG